MPLDQMNRPNYVRVKAQVQAILDEFGIDSPPVNPVEIARGMSIAVKFVTFDQ